MEGILGTEGIINQIIRWNRERNGLDFNVDTEIKMLTEEVNEFFMAETKEDRLREAADFKFVWTGTLAKCLGGRCKDELDFMSRKGFFDYIKEWADVEIDAMTEVLEEDGTYYLWPRVLEIVTKANLAKPKTKNVDGKVIKGDDYTDPIEEIRQIIKEEVLC